MNQVTENHGPLDNTPVIATVDDVLISFPCEAGKIYSWRLQLSGHENRDARTKLFEKQYEWQTHERWQTEPDDGTNRYATCHCNDGSGVLAKFVVRKRELEVSGEIEFSLARFPKLGLDHREGCRCRNKGFDFARLMAEEDVSNGGANGEMRPGRDFAGLADDSEDPELREIKERTSRDAYKETDHGRQKRKRTTEAAPSLRTLGTYLLTQSGVCDWRPAFAQRRDERTFNGMIAGAIERLSRDEIENRYTRLLNSLPTEVVPWSYFRPAIETERSVPAGACMIAYGFISHFDPPTLTGAQLMTIRSNPEVPLLVPAAVLAEATRNAEMPFNIASLPFPIWAIFVARRYGGVLKVTALEGYRVTQVGAIPVSTDNEERMVEFLMNLRRHFRRLLLPPAGIASRHVPDFQLLDTSLEHYLEVAGLMADAKYAGGIAGKEKLFGKERIRVWDTRRSLKEFVSANPDIFRYETVG